MKYYKSYMDRQEISPAVHENLLNLEAPARRSRPWVKYGALAACAALIIGVGVWRLAPAPAATPNPPQSAGQFASDYEPLPGEKDVVEPGDCFVVDSPVESGKLMFPMIPGINYQDITDRSQTSADMSRVYLPGSFMADLTKEDIRTIFWGPQGKPEAVHPKTEQGDLPWMLFWDGYTLRGQTLYDGQGQLMELTIWGEKDKADFELELRVGGLPFTCCIDLNRGDQISEFNGVEVAGWSQVYDRDGDGRDDYICGSEFMIKNDIGVRFVNRNGLMRAEYEQDGDMDLGGAQTFNALFVRQALTGGLYLDHLAANENIPAWREEEFAALTQARQEADFAPYLPKSDPEGYEEFFGHLTYQEDRENTLHVSWSRHYSSVIINIHREDTYAYNLVSPDEPELYDLRLYPVPWCYSVPEEYHETVDRPAFRAEDMSLNIVEARWNENDMSGRVYSFDVLHPDGTVVFYRFDGMTAEQVWALVEETL